MLRTKGGLRPPLIPPDLSFACGVSLGREVRFRQAARGSHPARLDLESGLILDRDLSGVERSSISRGSLDESRSKAGYGICTRAKTLEESRATATPSPQEADAVDRLS